MSNPTAEPLLKRLRDAIRYDHPDMQDIAQAAIDLERGYRAIAIIGELAALIPLSETIEATRTGATMIQWFKEHLK